MYKQKSNVLSKNIIYLTSFVIAGLFGSLNASSVYGAAEVVNYNFKSDFEFTSEPLCGPPSASFTGTAHFSGHLGFDATGQAHFQNRMNYFNVKGTDLSGDKYVITETDHFTQQTKKESETNVIHTVINGKLIHNGKETDTGALINLRSEFDEQGTVKTTVEKIDFKCSGQAEDPDPFG